MRERHFAEYRKMVEADDDLARYALEEVQRIDAEREAQSKVIAQAEAVVSEWTGPPDLGAALDFYRGLTDLVNGKGRKARGAKELNDALHGVGGDMGLGPHRADQHRTPPGGVRVACSRRWRTLAQARPRRGNGTRPEGPQVPAPRG